MKKKTKNKTKSYNKKLLSGLILTSSLVAIPAIINPMESEAVETIRITQDDSSKKQLETSQLRVWLNQGGNYGMQLVQSGATIFFSTQNAFANIIRSGTYTNDSYPRNYGNLTFKSFVINNNVIEQTRTDGTFDYILRISIVNATTQGAYLKVEMEAKNLTPYYQDVGISFNMDTMINGNDSSPFRIVENGWEAFHGGVQATAYYQDVFHTTQADAIFLGHYSSQYAMPLNSFYLGQEIYPGDSGAGFYYQLESVSPYASRKESWIIGLGPKNANPSFTLTAPTNNQTFYTGQTLPIAGTVIDSDYGDTLDVKWAIDGGAENTLTRMTANGSNQAFNYNYTLPSNLSEGWHTLQFWVMDDKGGTSSSNSRQFYVNNFVTPSAPTFSNVTTNSLTFAFNKGNNVASTTYEVYRAQGAKTYNMGTTTSQAETGLSPNTLYQYKVRAKNTTNAYTAYSAVSNIYTLANKPNTPNMDGATAGTLKLSWGDNGNPSGTKYHYEVRNASTNAVVKSGDVTTTSANVTGVPTNVVYNVYVKAVNGDGKATEELYLGQIYQDTINPDVTITKSTTNWIKGDVTLTATATDNLSGVRYITLPDGTKVNSTTATYKVTANGTYTFGVTDNSGNTATKDVVVTNIDKDASVLTLTQTPAQWTNTPVKINASAVDNGSGVKRIQLPDGNWVSASNANYTVSTNGDYTFWVEDNVGNKTSKTIRISNIDMIVPKTPSLSINAPENTWVDQDVLATIKDNGDEGGSGFIVEYKLEGAISQDWREYTDKVKIEKDGKTKIIARVRDNAGNISPTVSKSFQIDQDAPTITVTPDVYLLTNTDVNLTVKANDNGGQGVKRIQMPNGVWVNKEEAIYTVGENGTYTFKAEDNAGHVSSYEFRVSNIKKNVLITPIRPVDLELHSEDISEVTQMRFQNEDEAWSSWMTYSNFAEWVLSEEDGLKHVWVQFKDKVGNVSERIEDIIILDQTKPDLELVAINDDDPYTRTREVKLSIKGKDNLTGVKSIFLSNDNKNWNEYEYTEDKIDWVLPAGDGTKTVYAKISDGAGNLSTIKTDSIFLDMTKPLADILINNGDAYSATREVQLKLTYSDGGSGVDKVKVIEGEHEYTLPAPTPNSPVTIPWTLDFGVVKTVSILVTDKAGNTSELMSDSITVDKLTIKQFSLSDVVNPLEFDRKHPFEEKVWAFEPQPMIAGGNITFDIDVKSAYDRSVVDDSVNYKVEVVGEGSYHKAFVGTMDKSVDHYTKTITIPKDAPNGAKVYFTGTATRVLTVSPYDTQTVYFPGDTDASQRAFIGVVDENIYDVIRFNETK